MDERSVVFTLKEPYAPLPVQPRLPDRPDRLAGGRDGTRQGLRPECFAGTGAFTFGRMEQRTRSWSKRNADYWGGAPALEAVVFRPITDANTRVAEMLAGGIDMMVEFRRTTVASFDADLYTVHEQAGPHVWFLILNAKEGPFADKRVRQAVNYAIDKKALVENVLQGTAEIAAGPTPPAFAWAYNESLQPYPHDPDKARRCCKEAG